MKSVNYTIRDNINFELYRLIIELIGKEFGKECGWETRKLIILKLEILVGIIINEIINNLKNIINFYNSSNYDKT